MIRVTIEFQNIEEAILGLGKLGDLSPRSDPPQSAVEAVAADEGQTVTQLRRSPRSDRGTRRGPYKKRGAPAGEQNKGGDPAPTPVVPYQPAAPVAPTPAAHEEQQPQPVAPAAASPVATKEDVQEVVEKLFAKGGIDMALGTLQRFGVNAVRFLKPDQYDNFVSRANGVLAGEEI
jgi:hypothetical protein